MIFSAGVFASMGYFNPSTFFPRLILRALRQRERIYYNDGASIFFHRTIEQINHAVRYHRILPPAVA